MVFLTCLVKKFWRKSIIFSLSEAGNKVVEKGWPTEAVGVVVRINNKIQVILIVYLYNFQFLDSLQSRVAMRVASVCETSGTFSLLTESKKIVFKISVPERCQSQMGKKFVGASIILEQIASSGCGISS